MIAFRFLGSWLLMVPVILLGVPLVVLAVALELALGLALIGLVLLEFARTPGNWTDFALYMRVFVAPRWKFFNLAQLAMLFPRVVPCPCGECSPDGRFVVMTRGEVMPPPDSERTLQ